MSESGEAFDWQWRMGFADPEEEMELACFQRGCHWPATTIVLWYPGVQAIPCVAIPVCKWHLGTNETIQAMKGLHERGGQG